MDSSLVGVSPCCLLGFPSLGGEQLLRAATKSRGMQGTPVPFTNPVSPCACVVAAGKQGPENAYHMAAVNCMPCTFARSEHTEAQCLSFPCFSHIQTRMKKQIPLGFDLLILKYSKQRTSHLFLPGTIFPAHLGRSPVCPQPQ